MENCLRNGLQHREFNPKKRGRVEKTDGEIDVTPRSSDGGRRGGIGKGNMGTRELDHETRRAHCHSGREGKIGGKKRRGWER